MNRFASFRSKVASTYHEYWFSDRYPDFVTEGVSDQKKIMEAICTVKKASFDGVDCVGGDDAATGTVRQPLPKFFMTASEEYLEGNGLANYYDA